MYNNNKKSQAVELRKNGKSLLFISKELKISKSTASLWLRDEKNRGLYSTMTKQEWMKYIQAKSKIALNKRTQLRQNERIESAIQQLSKLKIDNEMKRSLLSFLYWAEGSKGEMTLDFANTDPQLCLIFTTLLRDAYKLDESKFRIRLHLHKYHNEDIIKQYWSNLLHIPTQQFNKTVWKKEPNSGKRYRKNFYGICFVKYNSVDLQKRIMAYAHLLGEKLTKSAPIA